MLDAARGNGLTRNQILLKVELPLALPTIIAGIRVAAVTSISLVTVAAFVLPEGLGKSIFDALNKGDFNTQFIAAGGLCVILALVADALLAGSQQRPSSHDRGLTTLDGVPAWATLHRANELRDRFRRAFTFISRPPHASW